MTKSCFVTPDHENKLKYSYCRVFSETDKQYPENSTIPIGRRDFTSTNKELKAAGEHYI